MRPYWPCLLISLAACAGSPRPNESFTRSVAAVRGAQEAGAEQVPEARLHLTLAQEQIVAARRLMQEGDNERAAMLTLRAKADADLALALARENTARVEAEEARIAMKKRREELSAQREPSEQSPEQAPQNEPAP